MGEHFTPSGMWAHYREDIHLAWFMRKVGGPSLETLVPGLRKVRTTPSVRSNAYHYSAGTLDVMHWVGYDSEGAEDYHLVVVLLHGVMQSAHVLLPQEECPLTPIFTSPQGVSAASFTSLLRLVGKRMSIDGRSRLLEAPSANLSSPEIDRMSGYDCLVHEYLSLYGHVDAVFSLDTLPYPLSEAVVEVLESHGWAPPLVPGKGCGA